MLPIEQASFSWGPFLIMVGVAVVVGIVAAVWGIRKLDRENKL